MVDIDEYLSKTKLADKSKKTYKQAHKKLTDGLENSIIESSQRTIIKVIPTLTPSLNSQQALLNIAIIMFRENGKKFEMLDAAREANKLKLTTDRNKGNAVKLDELPSRKQIDDYLNKLYNEGEWRSYIINYLLANIYVRNKDVNALIVSRVGKDKENYIVNRKNDVLFVRRDYKTKGTYGEKQNQIKSAKLKKAVDELQKESEKKETPLLAKINGQRIGDDSLTNYIKERTLKNITESDMMKITINQIDETGDLRKLKMISDNRGTSIKTLIDNYNLKGFRTEDVGEEVKVTNDKGMDLMVKMPVPVPPVTEDTQDTEPPPPPEAEPEKPKPKIGRPKKDERVNKEVDEEFGLHMDTRRKLYEGADYYIGGIVYVYGNQNLESNTADIYNIHQFNDMYEKYVNNAGGTKAEKLKNLYRNLEVIGDVHQDGTFDVRDRDDDEYRDVWKDEYDIVQKLKARLDVTSKTKGRTREAFENRLKERIEEYVTERRKKMIDDAVEGVIFIDDIMYAINSDTNEIFDVREYDEVDDLLNIYEAPIFERSTAHKSFIANKITERGDFVNSGWKVGTWKKPDDADDWYHGKMKDVAWLGKGERIHIFNENTRPKGGEWERWQKVADKDGWHSSVKLKKTKKPRVKTEEELEKEAKDADFYLFWAWLRKDDGPTETAEERYEVHKKAEAEKARKKKERADRKAAKKAAAEAGT